MDSTAAMTTETTTETTTENDDDGGPDEAQLHESRTANDSLAAEAEEARDEYDAARQERRHLIAEYGRQLTVVPAADAMESEKRRLTAACAAGRKVREALLEQRAQLFADALDGLVADRAFEMGKWSAASERNRHKGEMVERAASVSRCARETRRRQEDGLRAASEKLTVSVRRSNVELTAELDAAASAIVMNSRCDRTELADNVRQIYRIIGDILHLQGAYLDERKKYEEFIRSGL